ncbi:amidohydrolase family protein [Frankia sp. AgB1.9]|nr:amidohydrolase family protein [Frankia sp. AgW1.1]MBL7551515.1 amidohydrolase family protein [Frankia sp. AgB1.9]MBL7622496.1 amidohydrolase family protein [Frankia sp. AgB1.8]
MTGDLRVVGGVAATGRPVEVTIVGGRVVPDPPPGDVPSYDATGCYVLPGLIDLQVNGAGGHDLTDQPDRLWDVAAALARFGVTAFAPTVISSAPEARVRALAAFQAGPSPGWAGAVPLGLHYEGPMIAAGRKGAHPERWLVPPSPAVIDGWSRDEGVLMATLAPELPGALDVIRDLAARGVLVSVGHTEATAAQVEAAVDAGARLVTHLGNAMPPLLAREPGPIGVALGGSRLVAGVIADGHHLDPLTLSLAWRALGPDRFLAVSDTTAALGLPDGPARLGDQDVIVSAGTVRLSTGTLAGSAASLPQCLRTLVATTGCALGEAVRSATATPAALVGDPVRGSLRPGGRGDVTVLDQALDVVATIVGGRVVYARNGGY